MMKNRATIIFIICVLFMNQQITAQSYKQAEVYSTFLSTDSNQWMEKSKNTLHFNIATQPLESEISVFLNPRKKYQTYIGIGAAITDAVAETYAKLCPSDKDSLLKMFFHQKDGLRYQLIRTNMNSCDFSSNSYTYVPENDSNLTHFSIEQDQKYKLPMIKDALKLSGNKAKLYISPWSPPAFMKTNASMLHGGSLKPQYYQPWADYFVKYIKELERNEIPVWGLTIQNEPMATQIWESCIYTAEQERDFLKNHLGPTLKKTGLGSKKIIIWDHNRDLIYHRVNTILSDPKASQYVWGIGYHWYETWTGAPALHENLSKSMALDPSKKLIFTEGCKEKFNKLEVKNWSLGEKYATNMIEDFNQGVVGWTDWNLILNDEGGPNHVGNFCFAPVHIKTPDEIGKGKAEFLITNAYEYIGHFSRYIKENAQRIESSVSRKTILTTSFLNSDNSLVVIVLNTSKEAIKYNLFVGEKSTMVNIPSRAIQTLILR